VNQAWGQTTIMARVQNQAYQQAAQADLATGANVYHVGQRSLAQVGAQQLDLSLLKGHMDEGRPLDADWIRENIRIERSVPFGSDEYFALAGDPEARSYLQSGPSVVFAYQGQVIAVEDDSEETTLEPGQPPGQALSGHQHPSPDQGPSAGNGRPSAPAEGRLMRLAAAMIQFLASLRP
jgi:hypothetical protein